MCDSPTGDGHTGWLGWPSLPAPREVHAFGDWIDLTYPLSPDVPRHVGSHGAPIFSRVAEMPAQPLNITRIDLVVHVGTHVDAPRHFFLDGPAMEAVPLNRLMGYGVVVRLDQSTNGIIEPADLEHAGPDIEPGDIVAIDTGWADRWGTPDWDHQPSLSIAAAHWLVERRVKLLAVDTPTPDLPLSRRPQGFTWPVHHILLGHGTLIAGQVANLRTLAGRRVEFLFAPLPIADSDGSPARVLARSVGP
jgi:kynurenine formamidase